MLVFFIIIRAVAPSHLQKDKLTETVTEENGVFCGQLSAASVFFVLCLLIASASVELVQHLLNECIADRLRQADLDRIFVDDIDLLSLQIADQSAKEGVEIDGSSGQSVLTSVQAAIVFVRSLA